MTTQIPSEFVGFVRQTGVRAFDRLASRANELGAPLRALLKNWTRLSQADKETLFDELIAAVRMTETGAEPPPAPRQKKAVKRYDPEEVAATLPRKPAAGKTPKPAAKKK